jgi:hypothetical protein
MSFHPRLSPAGFLDGFINKKDVNVVTAIIEDRTTASSCYLHEQWHRCSSNLPKSLETSKIEEHYCEISLKQFKSKPTSM